MCPARRPPPGRDSQLVNYLYNCDKKRIALVGFGENSINDNFRYHAAITAAAAWEMCWARDVWQWKHDPQECFDAFLQVYQYDAVICPNDVIAICLINECKNMASVSRRSCSSPPWQHERKRLFQPTITSVTMDMFSVGGQTHNVWRFLTAGDSMTRTSIKITVPSRILARKYRRHWSPTRASVKSPILKADRFYYNPVISVLVGLDNCISQRDALDMRIIRSIIDKEKYEQICEKYFISPSTLRYRLNKIFADAGVQSRKQFEQLIHTHLGEGNPFAYVE